jgi:hypothetical protein
LGTDCSSLQGGWKFHREHIPPKFSSLLSSRVGGWENQSKVMISQNFSVFSMRKCFFVSAEALFQEARWSWSPVHTRMQHAELC